MAIKKSDLYSSLWKSCDELRGGMDASQYKDYILTLLFLKYVSDKHEADPDSLIEIPEGCSFADIAELRHSANIGEEIDKIVGKIADANDLRGVIDVAFFNDEEKLGKGKEMVDRLSRLVTIFDQLDFRASRPEGDDLLGDAYEYLMRHFATESGKSKGQFYTPAEVSRILARVVGIDATAKQNQTIYDPTCGSGSLLLKAADEAPHGLTVYGQEKDTATWALARMNMILHGYETGEIEKGDTITSPGFVLNGTLKLHDFIVANPPFSTKSWSSGIVPEADEYKRFELGVPPAKNGDYAFLLHAVASLKSTGKAAIILPHGVLFRGGTEAAIRRNLVRRGLIKGVIGLPPNLFYGTGIPACIVVLDKAGADDRQGVFLVDASRGFRKDGPKNRLRSQDIHKVIDIFTKQLEVERYSRLVPLDEIASDANDFNLNIPRYVDASEPEDIQDLDAHVNGGIPNRDLDLLADYWDAFPSLREQLFEPARPGYSRAKVEASDVQATVEGNADFRAFQQRVSDTVQEWWEVHGQTLTEITVGTRSKPIIQALSEGLLQRFSDVPLVSSYDVYERLMTYWSDAMQDDVFLISAEGWVAAAQPRTVRELGKTDQGKPKYEDPDLVVGVGKSTQKFKMDLIPPELIVDRYFAEERAAVNELQANLEQATRALSEYIEEHGVEDGLLQDVVGDNGKVSKKGIADRIKEIKEGPGVEDELETLVHCRALMEAETAAKTATNAATQALDRRTVERYEDLGEAEVKALILDQKWLGALHDRVASVVAQNMRALIERVERLDSRYEQPLGALDRRAGELAAEVAKALTQMGISV